MTTPAAGPSSPTLGIDVLIFAVNVQWLATTIDLIDGLLPHNATLGAQLEAVFVLLLLLASADVAAGLALCLVFPVRSGPRLARAGAMVLAVACLLLAGGVGVPRILAGFELGPPSALSRRWLQASNLLLFAAHILSLGFLRGLARAADAGRLAGQLRAVQAVAGALLTLILVALLAGNETVQLLTVAVVWVGVLSWQVVYCFLLLRLREAAPRATLVRSSGGDRG